MNIFGKENLSNYFPGIFLGNIHFFHNKNWAVNFLSKKIYFLLYLMVFEIFKTCPKMDSFSEPKYVHACCTNHGQYQRAIKNMPVLWQGTITIYGEEMPLDFTIWYSASIAERMGTGECHLWFPRYISLSEEEFYWKKIVYFVCFSTNVSIQPIWFSVISKSFTKMK